MAWGGEECHIASLLSRINSEPKRPGQVRPTSLHRGLQVVTASSRRSGSLNSSFPHPSIPLPMPLPHNCTLICIRRRTVHEERSEQVKQTCRQTAIHILRLTLICGPTARARMEQPDFESRSSDATGAASMDALRRERVVFCGAFLEEQVQGHTLIGPSTSCVVRL